jgi:hypothetical protein
MVYPTPEMVGTTINKGYKLYFKKYFRYAGGVLLSVFSPVSQRNTPSPPKNIAKKTPPRKYISSYPRGGGFLL